MKTSEYLYENLPYKILENQEHICIDKIKYAKRLLHKLLEPPLGYRDEERINDVIKAIDFNEKLLRDTKDMLNNYKD